jgi:hypothetical protein
MKTFKEYLIEQRTPHDGDNFFDQSALHAAKNPPPYDPSARRPGLNPDYATVIHMHPKDFLSVARNGDNPDKKKTVDSLMASNTKFSEIPELHFKHDGEGHARVSGHEGRHRARALLAANVSSMPVILKQSYNGGDVAPVKWKSHFDGEFPHTLHGERGPDKETSLHSENSIPFPKSDPRK